MTRKKILPVLFSIMLMLGSILTAYAQESVENWDAVLDALEKIINDYTPIINRAAASLETAKLLGELKAEFNKEIDSIYDKLLNVIDELTSEQQRRFDELNWARKDISETNPPGMLQ